MDYLWWLQIGADVLLLVAVGVLLWRAQRLEVMSRREEPMEVDGFIAEASQLSQEFDRLLAEKRELIRTTLSTLDVRIAELQDLSDRLEAPLRSPAPKIPPLAAGQAHTPLPPPKPASGSQRPDFSDPEDIDAESQVAAIFAKRNAGNGGVTTSFSFRKGHASAPKPQNENTAAPSFRQNVMSLYQEGKTVQEIAQQTGRPRGEVELALGLNKD